MQDIAERIQAKTGLSKKEAADMLESIRFVERNIKTGEKIKLTGFGNFVVRQKTDRRGRNPQTGEAITIEASRVLTFIQRRNDREVNNSVGFMEEVARKVARSPKN